MMFKTIFSTILMVLSLSVSAKQLVTVYWPFGVGDFSVTQMKAIFDKANNAQSEYNFVLVPAPGAAGVVAAQRSLNDANALLAHSSAFFIRPLVFPKVTSYKFEDFSIVAALSGTPFALTARTSFVLPADKNQKLSIGVAGLGSTMYVIAEAIKKQYPNLLIVPYKTPQEITTDVTSGTLDLGLDFIRSVESNKDLKIIGITGSKKIKDLNLLSDLGIDGVENVLSELLIVRPKSMSTAQGDHITQIFRHAIENNSELKKLDELNYTNPYGPLSPNQLNVYYQTQQKRWLNLTKNIKLD